MKNGKETKNCCRFNFIIFSFFLGFANVCSLNVKDVYSSVPADAYESSRMLCDQYYLMSPEVEIKQVNGE